MGWTVPKQLVALGPTKPLIQFVPEMMVTNYQSKLRNLADELRLFTSGFDGLEVSCWPFVPKFAGSQPDRSPRIFRTKNIFSAPSFGGEVKPSVPCRSFTGCKRSLNVTCKSAFRQNSRTFLARSSTFRRWVLSCGDTRGDALWRKLERLTRIAQ